MRYGSLALLTYCLLFTGCEETEQEQAQQQQYEAQLQQQMIETTDLFKAEVVEVLEEYFELKNVLVESDAEAASSRTKSLADHTREVDTSGLNEETVMVWASFSDLIISSALQLTEKDDVDELRIHFEDISETMIQIVDTFRPAGYDIYVQSCPMVRDKTAEWLSRDEEIKNPYHGDRMLNCGEVIRRI